MRLRLVSPPRWSAAVAVLVLLLFGGFAVSAAGKEGKQRIVDNDGLHVQLIQPPKFGVEESMVWATPWAQHHGGCLGRRQITLFRNGVRLETQTQQPGVGEVFFGIGESPQPGTYVAKMAKRTIATGNSALVCRAAQGKSLKIGG